MQNVNNVIHVEDLSIGYGKSLIQRNLNFAIPKESIFTVMGGSGCGKTTLLRSLTGLNPPMSGKIFYDNKDFWNLNNEDRDSILRKNGVLFQQGALWSSRTLAENILLPLQSFAKDKYSQRDMQEIIALKLALVGLAGFEDFYPSEISGGMRKRAGLARALALEPEIVFFDEPSAGLDPISAQLLDNLILQLRDSLGTTFVVVTHELASIFAISTSSIFLDNVTKTQLALGTPKELLEHGPERVQYFLKRGEK